VVLCFEVCNAVQAFFSHANIDLPPRLERALRLIQVTPRLHEIHHSRHGADQRCNFAVMFSFWDRLFRTYRERSNSGREPLALGVDDVTAARERTAVGDADVAILEGAYQSCHMPPSSTAATMSAFVVACARTASPIRPRHIEVPA